MSFDVKSTILSQVSNKLSSILENPVAIHVDSTSLVIYLSDLRSE